MNDALIDKIAQAVLYEGYILYPYRRSTKNQQRWTFGCLFPRDYSDSAGGTEPFQIRTQCLLRGNERASLSVKVRFLQLVDRTVGRSNGDGFDPIDEIEIDGKRYQSWQEAIERTVTLDADLSGQVSRAKFNFPEERTVEPVRELDGGMIALVRTRQRVEGVVEAEATLLRDGVFRITVRAANATPLGQQVDSMPRDRAQAHAMASTHAILGAVDGEFISLIDPPPEFAALAAQCKQQGAWPVLVGEAGETSAMLASPIILYDYPRIAPESAGDLFDGTEIDEILSLRVMTLTDDEKRSAVDLDDRAAALLRRTEALARDQLMRLHGTMRPPGKVRAVHVADAELRAGDRVRLRPTGRADAFDIILRGKTATIAAIEQDYENRIHLAVTIDDDPGADIGAAGQVGHRFFFRPEEVEPIHADPEGQEGMGAP